MAGNFMGPTPRGTVLQGRSIREVEDHETRERELAGLYSLFSPLASGQATPTPILPKPYPKNSICLASGSFWEVRKVPLDSSTGFLLMILNYLQLLNSSAISILRGLFYPVPQTGFGLFPQMASKPLSLWVRGGLVKCSDCLLLT